MIPDCIHLSNILKLIGCNHFILHDFPLKPSTDTLWIKNSISKKNLYKSSSLTPNQDLEFHEYYEQTQKIIQSHIPQIS